MGAVLGAGEALDVSQRRCARARPWQLKSSEGRGPSPGGSGGRIPLPAQETRVRSLVREDPTCRGATKPGSHNDYACALEPGRPSY